MSWNITNYLEITHCDNSDMCTSFEKESKSHYIEFDIRSITASIAKKLFPNIMNGNDIEKRAIIITDFKNYSMGEPVAVNGQFHLYNTEVDDEYGCSMTCGCELNTSVGHKVFKEELDKGIHFEKVDVIQNLDFNNIRCLELKCQQTY